MKATFGEYIRELRTQNGLTLTQLAAQLGLDSANLSKIENNKRDFDQKRIPLLADIFEIEINQLNNEFISDQLGKQIYELDCSSQLLKVAEEKAEYRRTLKQKTL